MNFRAKPVSRYQGGKPRSAVSMAAYRSGEKLDDDRYQTTWDYSRKHSVYYTEIITPDDAPAWAHNRQQLWNKVEASEKRFDARVTREFTISLPKEMRHDHKIEVMREFVRENFTKNGLIADIAHHNYTGSEAHNPHCHIMITTRPMQGDRFGKHKDRNLDRKDALKQWRKSYMDICNRHLERDGYNVRITTDSLETRGITDRAPISESMAVSQMRKKHQDKPDKFPLPDKAKENDELKRLNQELANLQQELAKQEQREQRQRQAQQARIVAQELHQQPPPAPADQSETADPTPESADYQREMLKQWHERRPSIGL